MHRTRGGRAGLRSERQPRRAAGPAGLLAAACLLLAASAGAQAVDMAAAEPAKPAEAPKIVKAGPPDEPLRCEVYDPGFPQADCSYHGVYAAPKGKVYCTFSAHSIAVWTRVYRFDPASKEMELLFTPQTVTPEKGHVAQGKIHSPLGEYKGELYFATHSGHYKTKHELPSGETVKPYRGGYVYAVDTKTGTGRAVAAPLHNRPITIPWDQGVPLGGEALISTALDSKRGQFYALSWPSGIVVRVDCDTGEVSEYGRVQDAGVTVPRYTDEGDPKRRKTNPHYQRICRTLGLDDAGNVYGSAGYGPIWKYDRRKDGIVWMRASMGDATGDREEADTRRHLDQWRTIVWDDKEKVFYGIHWGTSWLFRFDPKADEIEPVMHWAPVGKRVKDYAQLGLTMGPKHTLYGFVHAPRIKKGVQRSVHLLTLNLDTMRFQDHGNVLGEDGMTVMFAETCEVADNGDVYSAAWMEIPQERHEEVNRLRKEGGVPEVRYTFVMSLIRIPAERVQFAK